MRFPFAACLALAASLGWAQDDFNLRLDLGAPGVDVTVLDPRGKEVFTVRNAGPLLHIDLPRGVYFVRADNDGVVRMRTVVVGEHSAMSAAFAWPA